MKPPEELEGLELMALMRGDYSRSSSDAKALALVDELIGPNFFMERFGKEETVWRAVFSWRGEKGMWTDAEGRGATRPEAICKAYIAAREQEVTAAGARLVPPARNSPPSP